MSKAEEKAWAWACENKVDPYSMGQAYANGYEQAEKDTIERAVKWLKENCYVEQNGQLMFAVDTDKFRNAMTEEKQSEN